MWKTLGAATASLLALGGCAQNWQRVDPSVSPAVSIETTRISRFEHRSRAVVKVDDGAKEVRSSVEFDCYNGTYRVLEATTLVGNKMQSSRFDQQHVVVDVKSTPGFASASRVACAVVEDAWQRFNQNPAR